MTHGRPTRLQIQTARQILELIRRGSLPAGHHLTEEALARRFGVSRTPIRAALRILARNGFLVARRNQGYFLGVMEGDLDKGVDLPASADEALYMRMARDLVRKKLPRSFAEAWMMRRYDASRSLVHTVLARMLEEGLVRRGKGRAWEFMPFLDSREQQHASYDLRRALEPAALLLLSFRPDRALLEMLRRRHLEVLKAEKIKLSSAELFELDASFHETLARMSGNNFFVSAIEQQNRMRRLIEYSGYQDNARLRAWCREHLLVIDALLTNNRPRAAEALDRHLRNARRQLLKGLPDTAAPALS